MDQCQVCNEKPGIPYSFYYGTKHSYSSGFNRTTTNYTSNGTASACLCDTCVKRFNRRKALTYFLVSLGLFVLTAIGLYPAVLFAIPYFIAFIVMVVASIRRVKNGDAELLAIKISRQHFRDQGYNEFYTTARYKSLFKH